MISLEFEKRFTAKDGTMVILRPLKPEDAAGITDAAESIVEKGEYIQKEKVRKVAEEKAFIQEMQQKQNMYIGVEINNKVVGIARVIRGELQMKEHVGVFRTWLADAAQGKGVGNKIMQYTLEWGKVAGLHKIWLTVFSANVAASHLYHKYGFIEEGVQRDQIKINNSYQDEIYMAYFFV